MAEIEEGEKKLFALPTANYLKEEGEETTPDAIHERKMESCGR